MQAAVGGNGGLVIGNVVGSNIANVLLILGLSALIVPLTVDQRLVRFEVPLLVGVSALTWFFAADGHMGRLEGLLLTAGAIIYTVFVVQQSRYETRAVQAEYEREFNPESSEVIDPARSWTGVVINVALIVVGLGLLLIGSRWLVDGASTIARALGVGDLLIGLTIVAVGTSLPELATSIVASVRGERDIAVGNVVGSNLFNLLFVLGASSLVSPIPVDYQALVFDFPIMLAAAIACLPVFFSGYRIDRWEGGVMLGFYAMYIAYLVAGALGNRDWMNLQSSVVVFLAPLVILTLAVSAYRFSRTQKTQ